MVRYAQGWCRLFFGGMTGCVSEVVGNLAGFVSFVGPVGYEEQLELLWQPEAFEECASVGAVVVLAWGNSELYCCLGICGTQMNLGVPSPSGLPDSL